MGPGRARAQAKAKPSQAQAGPGPGPKPSQANPKPSQAKPKPSQANAKKQEEDDCWQDMAMTGQTDCGYTQGWELQANCSAEETANNIAVPKKGWWRTGVDSPLLHRCPVLDACLGKVKLSGMEIKSRV